MTKPYPLLKKRKTFLVSLALALIAAYVAYFLRVLHKNEPLTAVASKVFTSLEGGDATTLKTYLHEHERKALGFDDRKLKAFIAWYRDCTAGFAPVGGQENAFGQEGYLLLATRRYRRNSLDVPLEIVLNRTDEGPRCFLSSSLVNVALYAKYGDRYRNETAHVQIWSAIRDGVVGERRHLEGMGLQGVLDTRTTPAVISWSRMEAFATQAAERFKRDERRPSPKD